jgi:hypothetical protein
LIGSKNFNISLTRWPLSFPYDCVDGLLDDQLS